MAFDVILGGDSLVWTKAGFPLSPESITPLTAPTPNGPSIENISPTPGSTIEPEARVSFDVVDLDGDLTLVFITASFADGGASCNEVVYNGTHLGSRYVNVSSATTIPYGLEFSLRRVGGWPADVTLRVIAYDSALSALAEESIG